MANVRARIIEDARRLLIEYFSTVLNGKDLRSMPAIFSPDVVYHSAGSPDIVGLPALTAWVREYLEAVSDYHATLEDTVAEVGKAALRWTCTGTQRGTLLGLPATGRRFTLSGITVFRVVGGRVVEGWVERDSLGLFRQLSSRAP